MKNFFLVLAALSALQFSTTRSTDEGLMMPAIKAAVTIGAITYCYYWYQKNYTAEKTETTSQTQENIDAIKKLNQEERNRQETAKNHVHLIEQQSPELPPTPILKQPKPEAKPIESVTQKEPGFLEKMLNYSADYEELYENNRDCFEN